MPRSRVAEARGTLQLHRLLELHDRTVTHRPFWERRRDDAARLNADLEKLPGRETAVAAIRDMIAEAETVLARIRGNGSDA